MTGPLSFAVRPVGTAGRDPSGNVVAGAVDERQVS